MVAICFKLIYECVSVVLRACMKVAKGKRFAFRRNSVSVVIKASSVSPLLLSLRLCVRFRSCFLLLFC